MQVSETSAEIIALIGMLDAIFFSVCYVVAMVNRNNLRWHVAFIIGATLIVLNPGMSRLLNQLKPGSGLLAAVVLPFIVPAIIFLVEKIRLKRAILKSPYFLFFCFWAIEIILFLTLPDTAFWKNAVSAFLK